MATQTAFVPREGTIAVRPSPTVGLGLLGVFIGAMVAFGFFVSGLLDHPQSAPDPTAAVAAPARPLSSAAAARPTRLRIPDIGVDTKLMELGLTAKRELEVPPLSRAGIAGWYRLSPDPGDVGPAVIAGHVDSKSAPAVFYRLHELVAGDLIRVTRSDRREAVFAVDRVERFAKTGFPTRRVYGATQGPELRLITCGGAFDFATGHYVDNVVVFAHIVSLTPAPDRVPPEEQQ
jgi:sortase (surface protein transpeptidase)